MRKTLEEWKNENPELSYRELYAKIIEEMKSGRAVPIKASGTNGQKPALYLAYQIRKESTIDSSIQEELDYHLSPSIKIDYYMSHPEEYKKDRGFVRRLSYYLDHEKDCLTELVSMNERSFEIFGREKFLLKEGGKRILKRVGISMDKLHLYETTEPIVYYTRNKQTPQNLLIIENKDTFFSMRRHLLKGAKELLGVEFGTLIYGAGKRILSSARDYAISVEPYMLDSSNHYYYFGDLDYEGLAIYENLQRLWEETILLEPFAEAYISMVAKAEQRPGGLKELPDTKEGQNRKAGDLFFSCLKVQKETRQKMRDLLQEGKYIPQECLTVRDF